jgi:serine/threonine protein kinase
MESLGDVENQCELMNKYGVNRVDYNGKQYTQIKNYIYNDEKILGQGAFATVYLGLDISDQGTNLQEEPRKVAIKKINIPANRATKK